MKYFYPLVFFPSYINLNHKGSETGSNKNANFVYTFSLIILVWLENIKIVFFPILPSVYDYDNAILPVFN